MDEEAFKDAVNMFQRAAQIAGKRLISVGTEAPILRKARYRVASPARHMFVTIDENLTVAEIAKRMGREL